jgi:hypothetical protein
MVILSFCVLYNKSKHPYHFYINKRELVETMKGGEKITKLDMERKCLLRERNKVLKRERFCF